MTTVIAPGTYNGLVITLQGTYSSELAYNLYTLEVEKNWTTGTATTLDEEYTDGYVITVT
jgi:hypothetical protein